ncbi:IS110 family transposase [Brevibacillus antibioticus]|uniref:IS110 family transposase n=1 Tax=Brevibacillus antibioticus TaxID=2570228 RepID=A0A4U2Y7B7_9BACL|nr:IS110 family transposase [Brevibacillus antibioticus]TKI56488.1 IS110 family transposase [Brevibacillus antibioticus]
MHHKLKYLYIGVDLHKRHHTAVMMTCFHEKRDEIQFENKPSAFPKFLQQVEKMAKREGLTPVFGLEDVGGYGRGLAMFLNENKYEVKSVNPALTISIRRSSPNNKKTDAWDAECVARILISNLDTLPTANPHDLYYAISQLVTRRENIVSVVTGIKLQLHQLLGYHYPSYKKFFSQVDGKTALAFWLKYPSPSCLSGVNVDELANFLYKKSNRYMSTKKAGDILSLVQQDGDTSKDYQEANDFLVRNVVQDLIIRDHQLRQIDTALAKHLALLDYKLETMHGISTVTAAELIAEIGDISRFSSADKLANFAGIAPVQHSSGNKQKSKKSKLGNRSLYDIFYNLAIRQLGVSRAKKPNHPVYHAYYERKLAEGKTKWQAIICVMRKLVKVIYSMMKNKTEYKMPVLTEQAA